MKPKLILSLATVAMLLTNSLRAEEGGAGHYMPGTAASSFDALPGKPSWAALNYFTYYDGDAGASRPLNIGGTVASGVKATAYAETVAAVYESKLTLLGGNYAAGLAIPYVWMNVKAQAELTGPRGNTLGKNVSDSSNGIGDMTIYPFMLGWTALGGQLKYDLRGGVYAPTGGYDVDDLANVGKNYWTFEPSASVSWISSKYGTEASLFAGFDFNTENDATHYQSGPQFHLDGTIEQHLPLLGGLAGIGASGFYYQQIAGDSGSGATLGDFEGYTAGVGPVISYVHPIGKVNAFLEVKWLPELDVENRTEGNYVWVKAGVVF